MRYFASFLIALGLVGLVVALGGMTIDVQVHFGHSATQAPKPLVLHASDNGKTVIVKVGQEVVTDLGPSYGAAYSSNPKVLSPAAVLGGGRIYNGLTPPDASGGGTGSGGTVGGATSGSVTPGVGHLYCGVLPAPKNGSPSCAPSPCVSTPNGPTICPRPCPSPSPITIEPMPMPASPGGVISGGSGIGNVFCAPNCFCSIACMSPMTGNAGGVESGGASSIYCQPCGCATYCPFPGPMLPAQNMPGVSPVQGGASTGGVATMMPWRCGQGQERWRALSPGKADISAGWNGVCGGGVPCPPFARPMWVGFVVHVIVKQ